MRVLFVDDHPGTRRAVRRRLETEGHVVDTVATCEEALLCTLPDVALVDHRLADGASGLDVVARLSHQVPCVVYTQSDAPEILREAVASGAVGYLLKSDPPPMVLIALEQALHGQHPISAAMTRHLLTTPHTKDEYRVAVLLRDSLATVGMPHGPEATFRAEHQVAMLFALAARFQEASAHQRPGWMSDEELLQAVWGRRERQPQRNNLNVLLHRVRRGAQQAGLDRGFIEKRDGRSRLVVGSVTLG